jgi:hypothetical protein
LARYKPRHPTRRERGIKEAVGRQLSAISKSLEIGEKLTADG